MYLKSSRHFSMVLGRDLHYVYHILNLRMVLLDQAIRLVGYGRFRCTS